MSYVKRHLEKDEEIIAKTHKSAIIFVREIIVIGILVAIICGFRIGLQWQMDKMKWVYISSSIIFVLFLLNNIIKFFATEFVLTKTKFVQKKNLIVINLFETSLHNIDGVEVKFKTPLQRICDAGEITIYTRNTKYIFSYIASPKEFISKINRQASILSNNRIEEIENKTDDKSQMKDKPIKFEKNDKSNNKSRKKDKPKIKQEDKIEFRPIKEEEKRVVIKN